MTDEWPTGWDSDTLDPDVFGPEAQERHRLEREARIEAGLRRGLSEPVPGADIHGQPYYDPVAKKVVEPR